MNEETTATTLYERAEHASRAVRARTALEFRVAIILGSGLNAFADELTDAVAIPYEEIPGFARSTVEGHAGRLVLGTLGTVPVAVMQGRFHYYEGYTLEETTFPVRVLGLMGIKTLILTNAAGGVNADFPPGALMLIADHLNLIGRNPLRGFNDERFGPRFPDLTEVYAKDFQVIAREEAHAMNLDLKRGVYAALSGPTYETPAEVLMLRSLGADAVGMSTVPEAIVARHQGIKVLGLSCITNVAAGIGDGPIVHDEVMQTGARVRAEFGELLRRVVPRLAANLTP